MTATIPQDWVTVADVAQWMVVSEETVRTWIRDGLLPAVKIRSVTRIREQALLEFLLEYSTV